MIEIFKRSTAGDRKSRCLTAESASSFPKRNVKTLLAQPERGRETGNAATDHGDLRFRFRGHQCPFVLLNSKWNGGLPQGIPAASSAIIDDLPLLDEERCKYQGDRRQKLDKHVEGRTGSVLERITNRVADDGRGVRRRPL